MPAKILLVEDEFLLREATCEDLRELGFDAVCAAEAAEAWELLESDPSIAGLITDIRMPGEWDGWELARKARAARPELPVIYVSGFSEGPRQPVSNSVFLKKPYRFEDIRSALSQVEADRPG